MKKTKTGMKTRKRIAKMSRYDNGWRPAIGWICAGGLFYDFIFYHLFAQFLNAHGFGLIPPTNSAKIIDVVTTAIMGTIRTYEKTKGISK